MTNLRQNLQTVTHPKKGCSLDTLAQLDHFAQNRAYDTLKKRAISKYYTNEILYPLIDLKNEREDMYWNTYPVSYTHLTLPTICSV